MTRSYLVRHADAGDRRSWQQPDEMRPLTEAGCHQAGCLVALLAGSPLERALSSPYVRCVQTLEPLAAARGVPVETTPVLAEGAGGRGAWELLAGPVPVVACSHGDVIEEALDLLAAAGVPLTRRQGETPKGATWALEVGEGRIVSGALL